MKLAELNDRLEQLDPQVLTRRREFCHLTDTPVFIPFKTPTKGTGGCHQMTVSPTATAGPGGGRGLDRAVQRLP